MSHAVEYLVAESEESGWLICRNGYPVALGGHMVEAIDIANRLAEEETTVRRCATVVKLDAAGIWPRLPSL
jgi:hypothetical protein